MSKLRIQQYMEKHKLTPLFEELMNKVLHDQPDDPLVYLIKCLYRKAALPVPKDLRPGTLRRSSPERIVRRSKSPEKTSASTQAWAVGSGPDLVDRSYDKPWQTHTRKSRTKEEDRAESPTKQVKNKSKQRRVSSRSPAGRKQKQGWVSDTKITNTTFDDLFEEDALRQDGATRHRKEEGTDIKRAWARNVGLEDGEDVNFRSKGYRGPRHKRNEDDPLAGEIMLAKEEKKEEKSVQSASKYKNAKLDAKKHRQDLEQALNKPPPSSASSDSGIDGSRSDVEDDAIELLEDPEDLRREGVTKISKSGYKLSRNLRHRQEEANVKLNINLIASNLAAQGDYDRVNPGQTDPMANSADPDQAALFAKDNPYGDYYESDLERPPTGMSYQSNRYSEFSPDPSEDEEFESVSQVVGPRKPVWTVPDSDGDVRKPDMAQTLPQRSSKHKQAGLSSTMPVSFEDPGRPPFQRSMDTDVFLQGSKSRVQASTRPEKESSPSPLNVRDSTRSLRSLDGGGGGWDIPDDTEVFTEVSIASTSARTPKGPPKAY